LAVIFLIIHLLEKQEQLFMHFNPSTACCLTSPTRTVSFRSPSYHRMQFKPSKLRSISIVVAYMTSCLKSVECLLEEHHNKELDIKQTVY